MTPKIMRTTRKHPAIEGRLVGVLPFKPRVADVAMSLSVAGEKR